MDIGQAWVDMHVHAGSNSMQTFVEHALLERCIIRQPNTLTSSFERLLRLPVITRRAGTTFMRILKQAKRQTRI